MPINQTKARAALKLAATTFREYGDRHNAKVLEAEKRLGEATMDETRRVCRKIIAEAKPKAARNYELADAMEAAANDK
jgi:hypothetical protein